MPRTEWLEEIDLDTRPADSTLPTTYPKTTPTLAQPRVMKSKHGFDLPVFNRTHGLLGYSFPGYDLVEIPQGRWTTVDTRNKPINKSFIYQHLLTSSAVNVKLPYRPFSYDKTHITLACWLGMLDGWAIANSNIVDQLTALDPEKYYLYPINRWHHELLPPRVLDLIRRPYQPTEWALLLAIPTEMEWMECKNTILYSMWETSKLPVEWKPLLARVKHLIVPARSQVELFRQGYDGDISVVPLGIDPETWKYQERPPRGQDQPFTVLTFGLLSARKAPIETVVECCYRAFSSVYGERIDNWRIILKTHDYAPAAVSFNDTHVEIISAQSTPQQLAELCWQADVGVFLSRYEGFGLPPREAMATGLPVIWSNHTGHADDCDINWNIPVPVAEIIDAKEMYANDKEDWTWFEPDFGYAADVLRQEYENFIRRERAQSPLGIRASQFIHANRTWKHTAQDIRRVMEQVMGA